MFTVYYNKNLPHYVTLLYHAAFFGITPAVAYSIRITEVLRNMASTATSFKTCLSYTKYDSPLDLYMPFLDRTELWGIRSSTIGIRLSCLHSLQRWHSKDTSLKILIS